MRKLYSLTFYLLLSFILIASLHFSSHAQITTYPYMETFGASGCGLPTGYSNSGSDPWDFQNTSETYMEGLDHTSNGGCFASMDDSGGSNDDSCLLTTPTFDLTSVPGAQLRFWWQNSNSTTSAPSTTGPRPWSNLYVDISTNSGVTWTRNVWSVTDSQQIGWVEAIVNLSSYISSTTVIRFRGLETRSFRSDMSLDDILIFEPQQWDAEVNALISPVSGGCGNASAIVEVAVVNNGSDTITSLPVFFQKNMGVVVSDTITDTILPNDSYMHTFSQTVDLSTPGLDTITVWSRLALDSVFSNDTLVNEVMIAPTITEYPYFQDFENGQEGWIMSGTNSSWAFGTPNKAIIQGASSGSNAFVNGGLTGTYNINENSEVTGPCFDLSAIESDLWVVLDIWYDAEFSWDGAALQYSEDEGMTWITVGRNGDPFNWYTDNSINGNPGGQQEGWSGTGSAGTLGWVQAKHILPASIAGKNNVFFRIAFGSDGSVVDDGFAFDNFAIVEYTPVEFGQDILSLCGQSEITLFANTTSLGTYLWNTTDTIDSLVVTSQGTYWVEFTDTLLNLTSSDTVEIIQSVPPAINFDNAIDTISINESIVLDPKLSFDLDYLWSPGNYDFPYLLVRGVDYGLGSHQFSLMVTDSLLCTDEESVTVVVHDFTGIDEFSEAEIVFYPNPVTDILNVELNGVDISSVNIELFSMSGELVKRFDGNHSLANQFTIDMSDENPGYYLIVFTSGDSRIVHQIIKQ